MNRERVIENAIMDHPGELGYENAMAIRNVRLDTNKRAGRLDVLLLPLSGPHRLVLVETKVSTAPDADGKCIGQLLKYLSFALRLGTEGVEQLLQYARDHQVDAWAENPTTPKKILQAKHEATVADVLGAGQRIMPAEIGLFIAIDGDSHGALPIITSTLLEHYGLEIGVAIVRDGKIEVMHRTG